ncbi:MAG TPA: uroporphyrinogen-III C-methyltransferase [Pseudomonadales bacterium]|nr:uroporphyrinogen-III C-methyltransferase [Pseudomonadales bacterium]
MTDITHATTNNSDNTNNSVTLPAPVLPVSAVENIVVKPHTTWLTRGALLILFLCNLATAAGGVWLWRQLDMAGREQIVQQEMLKQQTAQTGELKTELDEQIASAKRFRQQTNDILKENSEKLRGLDRIDTSYWRLAEAEFLLKQAHQRLFITRDADTADLLLASADGALIQQKDPGLLPIRSAIANDRAELRKVPRVDHDGIYLRLQALSSQVGMLTSDNRFLQAADDTPISDESVSSYADILWQRLLSIVRIRHYDQPVEPLLPPEQQLYLSQNLQLALVQAQLGLLQSQQETYASNLGRAFAWVNQYCQTNDPVVAAWLAETQELMRINIAPEMPDISDSLRIVQKLIEQRADDIRKALMLGDEDGADAVEVMP